MFQTHVSFLAVAFWQVFSDFLWFQVFSGSQVLSGGLRWIVFKMAQSVSLQCICFEYMFTIILFSDSWAGINRFD